MGNQVKQFGKFEGLNGNFKAVKTFHKLYVFINFPLKTYGQVCFQRCSRIDLEILHVATVELILTWCDPYIFSNSMSQI